ncbi:MAG: SEC-C metal-binding domain-containing protein, partial [Alphaproteobacteria bacterium]
HVDPLTGEDEFGAPGGDAASGLNGGSAAGKLNGRGRPLPTRNRNAGVAVDPNDPNTWGKVARNASCPCGSGKKFKHCHGSLKK